MKLYSIKIKDKEFRVLPLTDPEDMKKGLSGKPKLGKGKGLMFHFGEPVETTMHMRGMRYPIDMLFIDADRKVKLVKTMKVGLSEITVPDIMCVLEVNKGEGKGLEGEEVIPTKELEDFMMSAMDTSDESKEPEPRGEADDNVEIVQEKTQPSGSMNIVVKITAMPAGMDKLKKGGTFKMYEDGVKVRDGAMQVLDDTGKVLMNIDGGERIFSIQDTENIVELSKKIEAGEAKEEELGKLMGEIIHRQNTQEPEYV